MKTYQFKVTLQGTGDNPKSAWANAVEAFSEYPGNDDDYEQLVRCNNCMNIYIEDELIGLNEDNDYYRACPKCKTDAYLTDEWRNL